MLDKIALTLLIIGGLNWGSVGIFQFDLVAWICGGQTGIISRGNRAGTCKLHSKQDREESHTAARRAFR